MKLRSGKIFPPIPKTMPLVLESELEARLQEFKQLFSGNPAHAKELLEIISEAVTIEWRWPIREKIEEIYHDNELPNGTAPFRRAAGFLANLVMGVEEVYAKNNIVPEYRDIIQERIKSFDLETPLLGIMEDNNMELL